MSGAPLSARSHQFTLPVTLMELLCGRRPVAGETPLETMDRIRAAAPPELSELDEDLRRLVLRCLAADPADRFPDDRALQQALGACRSRRPAAPFDLATWVCERIDRP